MMMHVLIKLKYVYADQINVHAHQNDVHADQNDPHVNQMIYI